MVECGLIIALIAVVAIPSVRELGKQTKCKNILAFGLMTAKCDHQNNAHSALLPSGNAVIHFGPCPIQQSYIDGNMLYCYGGGMDPYL